MGYVLATERGVDFQPGHFCSIDSILLSRLPRAVEPEMVVVHSVVFSLFFLSNTLAVLIFSQRLRPAWLAVKISLFMDGNSSACVVAWLVPSECQRRKNAREHRQFGPCATRADSASVGFPETTSC